MVDVIRLRKIAGALGIITVTVCIICGGIFTLAADKITFGNLNEDESPELVNTGSFLAAVCPRNSTLIFNTVAPDVNEQSFEFSGEIAAYAFADAGFCVVSNPKYESDVYSYDINLLSYDDDYKNKISLAFSNKLSPYSVALDNDFNIYFSSEDESGFSILKFSSKGKFICKIPLESCAEQVMYIGGDIYCFCDGKCYFIDDNTALVCGSAAADIPCAALGENVFRDSRGRIIKADEKTIVNLWDFNADNCLCCSLDDSFYIADGIRITGANTDAPQMQTYYDLDYCADSLCGFNGCVYAGGFLNGEYRVTKINAADFIPFVTPTEPSETSVVSETGTAAETVCTTTQAETSGSEPPKTDGIEYTCENYSILPESKTICKIDCKTSVTKFKSSFSHKDRVVIYDRNNKPYTSGHIGTGMTAVFANDSGKTVYTLCVTGDITGEGNVNTLDLNEMFDYLLLKRPLSGYELTAADINCDGMVTNKDLLLLERLRISVKD